MHKIDLTKYKSIVFFTGAGMSAESGVPTYRGHGGIWDQYNYEEYACEDAFIRNPEKVMKFHEIRRNAILNCAPHLGHEIIAGIEQDYPATIITQNIDGMHQRARSKSIVELHGSVWRLRCSTHGTIEDFGGKYHHTKCSDCQQWLRPDITWFGDMMNQQVMDIASRAIQNCDLFVSIGTSGVVWPAAGFQELAKSSGGFCIEINPEPSELSYLYDQSIRMVASTALSTIFPGFVNN